MQDDLERRIMITQKGKERVSLLIAALRSGVYKQTRGQLRYINKFCCLGVACDIFRKTAKKGKWKDISTGYFNSGNPKDTSNRGVMPPSVGKWFGFTVDNCRTPKYPVINKNSTMVDLNDTLNLSFIEIADNLENWLNKQEVVG